MSVDSLSQFIFRKRYSICFMQKIVKNPSNFYFRPCIEYSHIIWEYTSASVYFRPIFTIFVIFVVEVDI